MKLLGMKEQLFIRVASLTEMLCCKVRDICLSFWGKSRQRVVWMSKVLFRWRIVKELLEKKQTGDGDFCVKRAGTKTG